MAEKGTVHKVGQDVVRDHIDTVNINSFHFNCTCSVIMAKLKTSSSQNNAIMKYKIDTGSDGNILPCHVLKMLFRRTTEEHLSAKKHEYYSKKLNKTRIPQLLINESHGVVVSITCCYTGEPVSIPGKGWKC